MEFLKGEEENKLFITPGLIRNTAFLYNLAMSNKQMKNLFQWKLTYIMS